MKKNKKDFNFNKNEEAIKIYKKIDDFMKDFGINQKQLSDATIIKDKNGKPVIDKRTGKPKREITVQTLINWKKGKRKPTKKKIEIVAAVLRVNPLYLTGESGNPAIKSAEPHKEIIVDSSTGRYKEQIQPFQIGNNHYDFLGYLQEMIQRRNDAVLHGYEQTFSIMELLGYKLVNDNDNLYLQIPESKKESILNYEQWSTDGKGIPITSAECDLLIKQLQSITELFENTIINYYNSNMAAFNMIEHEKLKDYKTLIDNGDGSKEIHFASKEEKEYFEKIFGKLTGNKYDII